MVNLESNKHLSIVIPTYNRAFEIGCEDWTNFVMSLPPSYKLDNKMKCIMDFGKVSGLFTLKNLIVLRMRSLFDVDVFSKYKKMFSLTIYFPKPLVFLIAVFPKILIKITYAIYKQRSER